MAKNNIRENIVARELFMQATFQMEALKDSTEEQLDFFLEGEKDSDRQKEQIKTRFEILVDNLDNIDYLIDKYSREWNIDRIPKADLAVLRVSVCEIMYIKEFPAPIIINDAVNMAKKFSDEQSYKYINGILGNILRKELPFEQS